MSMLYVGVAGIAVGLYSANAAANQSADQASAMSNAQNDAIAKQNMSQIVRNSYRTGMANLQFGLQKKRLAAEGFNVSKAALAAEGTAGANAAASGTVGASADSVLTDIHMKLGESNAARRDNMDSIVTNFNNDLEAMRMNALNETVDARKYEYSGPSGEQMLGGALMQGVGTFASIYAQRQISLGLGTTAPSVGTWASNSFNGIG